MAATAATATPSRVSANGGVKKPEKPEKKKPEKKRGNGKKRPPKRPVLPEIHPAAIEWVCCNHHRTSIAYAHCRTCFHLMCERCTQFNKDGEALYRGQD